MKLLWLAALTGLVAAAQPDEAKWKALNSEGIRLVTAANYPVAEARFRAALLEAEQFGEGDFRLWANLSNLALVLQEQGDLASSEKLYRRVAALREKYLGPDSAETGAALNNIAATLHAGERDAEADPILRRALLIGENAHDDRLTASVLNTLGLVLTSLGEDARAEPVLRRAIAIFEKCAGPDSLETGKAMNNLSAVYTREGDFEKAEELERLALPRYERNLPPGHPLLAAVWNNMFAILGAQKRYDEGEPYLRRAVDLCERLEPDSRRTQQIRANLAGLEAWRGHWQAAADILKQVIEADERLLGPNHPDLAAALSGYSGALKHLNQKAEAKRAESRAKAIQKTFH